ncbi:FmdE family protein [Desulfofustis glycolicus]|uniref:Formylmethanofuran dehydrogenase subunit E n=1 Tax=Desulfofustis glycolicus DSM 9705 TaxID=1121409 RepID=A0A1M5X0L6_9BACT|nr:FmdE family protein [Desulfofustis glycolicus]MCB2218701.1 TraR/DksA C4-type zinc finger protein [Desulfobulbaceae bacterium]SHH93387.1 formylmethanofuran dehydrogenase subunit E [Desulfofustis glycolicus DSM 9705]
MSSDTACSESQEKGTALFDAATWQECVKFHGHSCPGLAIGYRAALAARNRLNVSFSADEEIVCVTENDACGVDAVQVLTGCSIGKGNLIYRGTGKMAFSFFDRKNGTSIRILFHKPMGQGETRDREQVQQDILLGPEEELFSFSTPSFTPPSGARLFTSVVCEDCGEAAPEHKVRLHQGKRVCLDCFPDYSRGW